MTTAIKFPSLKETSEVNQKLPLGQKLLDEKIREMKSKGYKITRENTDFQDTVFTKIYHPKIYKYETLLMILGIIILTACLAGPFLLAGFTTKWIYMWMWGLTSLIPLAIISIYTSEVLLKVKRKVVNFTKCEIKETPLSQYINTKIPDICLTHIDIAKSLGIKENDMTVLSPYVTNGSEKDYKPDPIIVTKMDEELIEITFWE